MPRRRRHRTRRARRLGLRPDAPYQRFFGLIKEHKGLTVLLEAFALARRERPDLRVLVAGQPMSSWRRYADDIARLGLEPSVDLHLRFIATNSLPAYFGAADLVVLPYRKIFQSGVVIAAYTFQRPVVATRVGGLAELVEDGQTGFLVPRSEPSALAETLVHATADLANLSEMGARAGKVARERHGWGSIAEQHEQIYEAVTHWRR